MNERFKRALTVSLSVHVGLVLLMLVVPVIVRILSPRKPREAITFVSIVEPGAALPVPRVEEREAEPPPPKPEVKEEEIPEVKKDPTAKSTEKKDKPKIKVNTNIVHRAQGPSSTKTPPLTPEQIRKLLALGPAGGTPSAGSGSSGSTADPTALDWYYALVKAEMYRVWIQPGDLSQSAGLMTKTSIRVWQDGRVTDRRIIRRSGNPVMDASVEQALDRLTRLDRLPKEVRETSLDITIDFELTGGLSGAF
jgi:TonB family protein